MSLPYNKISSLDDAVWIALGSNLRGSYDSVQALLEAALERFPEFRLKVSASSRWWRSTAWPDTAHPEYLNSVVLVETCLDPCEIMKSLLTIEDAFGRHRGRPNQPRTLDLDLIAHGRLVKDAPGLILPHPRAHERRFVMGPLAEIAPDWIHPVLGRPAAELAARASVGVDAAPIDDFRGDGTSRG